MTNRHPARNRRARAIGLGILLTAIGLAVAATIAELLIEGEEAVFGWSILAAGVLFAAVGALVVSRRPENSIGWLFSTAGLLWILGTLADRYATYTYVTNPNSLPGGVVALWVGEWYWLAFLFLAFVFTLFLFPTGRLPSRRWRPLFWLAAGSAGLLTISAMLEGQLNLAGEERTVRNPIGLLPVNDVEQGALGELLALLILVSGLSALASLIVRFRRSRGDERQQLKWFTFAGVVVVVGWLALGILDAARWKLDIGYAVLLFLLPVAVGIAVLKYRLYDIDRIINKTLVYGAVTAVLLAGYTGAVLLIQALLPLPEESPATVAASTLAMAALFGPLRKRTQDFVDRRFYRARYDAVQTVERFGARLRHETDLESLTSDLVDVVARTVQPAHASVWLRAPSRVRWGDQ
jgi:hypothetical protein